MFFVMSSGSFLSFPLSRPRDKVMNQPQFQADSDDDDFARNDLLSKIMFGFVSDYWPLVLAVILLAGSLTYFLGGWDMLGWHGKVVIP
jgi:hypothetical protein